MEIIVFLFLIPCSLAYIQLNDTEYERMPPLVRLDPYEDCLQKPPGAYCVVNFSLVSDTENPLLNMIKEYSANTISRYNHTNLRYGICLNDKIEESYDPTNADLKYTLEVHLNESLWNSHRMKVRVTDDYICDINNKTKNKDIGDILVAIVIIIFIIANVIGSICDYYNADKIKEKGLLLSFSVMRNWKKLVGKTSKNPRFKPLRAIHGGKGSMACFVVLIHSILPCYVFINNPKFVEQVHENAIVKFALNGPVLMQIFFIISGFLLIYNCLVYEENREIKWAAVPWLLLLRWLRVTPAYALVLSFVGTLGRYVSSGPAWQKIIIKEADACRSNWWRHLSYVNNYSDHSECMLQSWYLATDFQLFCIGVVLYVVCKDPRVRRVVLPLALLMGITVSGLQTYLDNLDGILVITPELVCREFRDSANFNSYSRPINNFSGYAIGMILGYLMHYWQKNDVKGEKYYKYRHLYRALLPCAVAAYSSGVIFFDGSPRKPLYLRMLFGSLLKPVFAIIVAAILAGMMLRIEGVYSAIMEWRGWIYLSRLSYSVYLVHIPYIRVMAGSTTKLLDVNAWFLMKTMIVTLVNCYALALVFWTLVEAPVDNLVMMLLGRAPKEDSGPAEVKDQPRCVSEETTPKNKQE